MTRPASAGRAKRRSDAARRIVVPRSAFNACYLPYLNAQHARQIFFGGAGSGKSVFLAGRAVLDALTGRNTLVVRRVARTLRGSCYNEVRKAAARLGVLPCFRESRTEMAFTCRHNGAQILFLGLDDVEKIKSLTPRRGPLTDIWMEEATECRYHDLKQLEKRLRGHSRHKKRLTMSFNPVSRGHWLYRTYFTGWQEGARLHQGEELLILRTTHRDNQFLTEDDRRAYEQERDPYYHRVYTLGEWGELAGQVFTNWHAEDLSRLAPQADRLRVGLDFGFARDPAAAVRLHLDLKRGRVYVLDELYQRGLSNAQLAERLRAFAGEHPIICDSAEPKSIAQLRGLGIRAVAARKGPDSLRHGIRWLQGMEVVVDSRCTHTMAELQAYRWRQDASGECLPIPEGEDHLIDAMRYALERDSKPQRAQAM